MTDQELKDLVASLAVKSDRLDAQLAQTSAQLAKTDAQLAESKEQMLLKSDRLDAQLAATDAKLAKSSDKLDRLAVMYGGIADNQGSVAEEFFFNSLSESKQIGAIHFDEVLAKVYGGKIGAQQEYDLVLLNGDSAAIVEVKYKVHPAALEQVLKQLSLFKQHFPEHSGMKLYGGVAGFSIPEEVVQDAHQRGLFVLKRQGEAFAVDAGQMKAF